MLIKVVYNNNNDDDDDHDDDLSFSSLFLSELNKLLKPDKLRANELRREFQKGFVGIAKRIWPRLAYVHGVVSGKEMIF